MTWSGTHSWSERSIYWKDIGTFPRLIRGVEEEARSLAESLSMAEKHSQGQATGEMALSDALDFAAPGCYSSPSLISLCCLGREWFLHEQHPL